MLEEKMKRRKKWIAKNSGAEDSKKEPISHFVFYMRAFLFIATRKWYSMTKYPASENLSIFLFFFPLLYKAKKCYTYVYSTIVRYV